jgi:hypothetical protein
MSLGKFGLEHTPFHQIQEALGQSMGDLMSGMILSLGLMIALLVAFYWIFGQDSIKMPLLFIPMGIGIVFATAAEWLPIWALVAILAFLIVAATKPFWGE